MAVVSGHTNPGCGLAKHHIQEQQTPIFSESVNSANRLRKNRSIPSDREPIPARHFVDNRTYLSETLQVRGNEFIRRVQRHARKRSLRFEWRPDLGKGSHGILILGDRRTVVRNPKDELKTGTLHAMLKQLGLSRDEI